MVRSRVNGRNQWGRGKLNNVDFDTSMARCSAKSTLSPMPSVHVERPCAGIKTSAVALGGEHFHNYDEKIRWELAVGSTLKKVVPILEVLQSDHDEGLSLAIGELLREVKEVDKSNRSRRRNITVSSPAPWS